MTLLVSFIRMRPIAHLLCAVAFFLLLVGSVYAQSNDVRFPTAVRTNELAGTIAARDVGDARLTDHFYTFNAAPGDVLITVESRNLNGDFDIFTASELRPLLKVTVYAESTSAVAKNIYLRKPESLILRVEARSPNDDDGSYHIRFSGSFQPISGGPLAGEVESGSSEPNKPASRSTDKKVTRVSSVGARIEEPPPEVAAAVATPTPEEAAEAPKPAPKPSARRGRAPARRTRTKPAAPAETASASTGERSEATKQESDTEKKEGPEKKETPKTTSEASEVATTAERKPKPVRRGPARRSPAPRVATKPAVEPPAESGPRLVIEVKDGTRIEHFMSRVRRVTVENGQVVVVGTNGKIERVPMANVVRMSIGP